MSVDRTSAGASADSELTSLQGLVAQAFWTSAVRCDEHYTLTAFVTERVVDGRPQTLVVELMDHGPDAGPSRWNALAYVEGDCSTGLICAASAAEAIGRVASAPCLRFD